MRDSSPGMNSGASGRQILGGGERVETSRPQSPERRDFDRLATDAAEAVEQLMAAYGADVLRTAFFYLGDRGRAEDVSQEVFVRAYQGWSRFRGESAPRTWLVRITINLCRDRMRSRAARETPADPVSLDRARPLDLEEQAMARLERTAVLKEVLALPWPYQEALYLYYYLDLDVRETARATGVAEGTVRTRLHRARALLRERLERGGWTRGDD